MAPQSLFGSSTGPPEQSSGRVGRALSLSLGTHVAGALVLATLAAGRGNVAVTNATRSPDSPNIVWFSAPGRIEGSGDRGGGDQDKAPPRAAQRRGPGAIAVPVRRPDTMRAARDPKEPENTTVSALLQPATAGIEDMLGLLQPVSIGDPTSRGPGLDTGVGNAIRGTGLGDNDPGSPGPGPGGDGFKPPVPIRQVRPEYTADAMRAKIQGTVGLEAVVLPDGTVGDVKIVRSLDPVFGLDASAIRCVKEWRFAPGTRLGKPIPVLVAIELTFTLR